MQLVDFLPRTGRALVYPVYKGTFERGDELKSDVQVPTAFYRDHAVDWSKDLGRTIDYLETRKDLRAEKLTYFGLSWGATQAPIMISIEPRIKAAVLVGVASTSGNATRGRPSQFCFSRQGARVDGERAIRQSIPHRNLTETHVPFAGHTPKKQASCGVRSRAYPAE